jgi:hypothetical protein
MLSDFAGDVYQSVLNHPPPLHTVTHVHVFIQIVNLGGGGGSTREKGRGAIVPKAGSKYQHD